jgi:DNA repair exonuclease SbcCD ATPase subunit
MATATAPPTDSDFSTDFDFSDVHDMGLEALMGAGPADTEAVKTIDTEIRRLRQRLQSGTPDASDVEAAREDLKAAREELNAARIDYELGGATEDDVRVREEAVAAAKEELKSLEAEGDDLPDERRTAVQEAIRRLEAKRKTAMAAARSALAERAADLRDELAKTAHEQYFEALATIRRLKDLRTHANQAFTDGRRSVLTHARAVPSTLDPDDFTVREVLKNGGDAFGADVDPNDL